MKIPLTIFAIFFCVILASVLLYMQIHQNTKTVVATHTTPCAAVTIITPKENTTTASPLSIAIIIDNSNTSCHWTVFEAQAGIAELRDGQNHMLGKTVLKTNDDWQLAKPVPYNGLISFTQTPNQPLTLRIIEENPSGKPNPQQITIPLISQ